MMGEKFQLAAFYYTLQCLSFQGSRLEKTALQCRVHILADGIPRLTAELAVHQVVEIILLRCTFELEGIARFEERARAGFGSARYYPASASRVPYKLPITPAPKIRILTGRHSSIL